MAGGKLVAPNVSRREFAQNLADSGIFDAAELVPDSDEAAAPDGLAVARELVAAGKLTRYQAEAVLGRRFGDLRIGNYEILDRLGAGGMGTVYKARHRRMKRVVALKVLSKEVAESDRFVQRFQREVETIARLAHPNIVMAFDADEAECGPFLVMEFVDGRDLATEVEAGGPLPPAAAADRILQAARGLEYAHGRGIVHRDIKPGNILRAADGVVKVADLGLARLSDPGAGANRQSSLTQAGMVVGTADYMSPEQAVDSGTVDHRADVYSLGCTLYFLLTGDPPYESASLMGVLLAHRDHPIPDPTARRTDLPPELVAVYRRMVAKRPEDRYQSMAEVAAELERVRSKLGPLAAPAARSDETVDLAALPASGTLDDSGFEVSPAGDPAPSPAGLVVVVAESSRTQAGIIRIYLKQLGIEATHAVGSGREAIETAKRVGAGVIVSSMHLSDMTGIQLAAALRADPGCAHVGFILATSESESETNSDLRPDSRSVVMPKPFDLQRLARSIATVTG